MKCIEVLDENQRETVELLAREIWTEHYIPIIGREQVDYMLGKFQSKQAISGQIKTGMRYFLMLEEDECIGYLGVQARGNELFLGKIYVKRSRRGKGYGKQAIRFVEALARESGFRKIVLTVNRNNTGSIAAYEKTGFRKTGALMQDIGNGFVMDDYTMGKDVR